MQITNGKVTYGRTLKTGDYENKRVDVELSFSVGEGESYESILAQAAIAAHRKAHEMLGLSVLKGEVPAGAGTKEAAASALNAKDAKQPPIEAKRPPGRPPKATPPPAVDHPVLADPTVLEDPKPAGTKVDDLPKTVDPLALDELAIDDFSAPAVEEITDEQLHSRLTIKNSTLKNPIMIRQLVLKYAGPGKSSVQIPQEKRVAFLAEVEAL